MPRRRWRFLQKEEHRVNVGDENFFELPEELETALGLARKLNQIELMEFLDKYNSLEVK